MDESSVEVASPLDSIESHIARENIFGGEVLAYRDLSDEEKKRLWLREAGQDFSGEVGVVRRYVIGVPKQAVGSVVTHGFRLDRKVAWRGVVFALHKLGGTEGKGVYATTNPVLASREYGPTIAVVDIACGKEINPDASFIFGLTDRVKEPLRWGAVGWHSALFVAVIGLNYNPSAAQWALYLVPGIYATFQALAFNAIYSYNQADTARLTPNWAYTFIKSLGHIKDEGLPLFLKSHQRHEHWRLVRDPKRVKVVAVVDSPQETREYTRDMLSTGQSL